MTMTETTPMIEKIRAGRRAALASLNTRLNHGGNVVSIFENAFPRREATPEFHSVRSQPVPVRIAADSPRAVLVLKNRIAA